MSGPLATGPAEAEEIIAEWFDEQFEAIVAGIGDPGDDPPTGPPGSGPTTTAPLPPEDGGGFPRGRENGGRPAEPVRQERGPWPVRRVRSPPRT